MLLGSGGGTAIIATTLWVFAANKASEARSFSVTGPESAWKAAKDSTRSFEAGAWVSSIATVGLLGAGLAMVLMSSSDGEGDDANTDTPATTWAPVVTPTDDGVGVGAVIRF